MELKEKKRKNWLGQFVYGDDIIGLAIRFVFKDGTMDEGIIEWYSDDDEVDDENNPIFSFNLLDRVTGQDKYMVGEDETKSITIIKEK